MLGSSVQVLGGAGGIDSHIKVGLQTETHARRGDFLTFDKPLVTGGWREAKPVPLTSDGSVLPDSVSSNFGKHNLWEQGEPTASLTCQLLRTQTNQGAAAFCRGVTRVVGTCMS